MKSLITIALTLGLASVSAFAGEVNTTKTCKELDKLLAENGSQVLSTDQVQLLQKVQQIWATTCIEQQQQQQVPNTALGSCTVSLMQWGVNGSHLTNAEVISELDRVLVNKGYLLTSDPGSHLKLNLHYFGMLSENGRSKTVGTTLTFSKLENDKKVTIAQARSERFLGSEKNISRSTLRENIKKIDGLIPNCI